MTHANIIKTYPKVTILMGVLNGAAHLEAQLASIAAQTHKDWHLVCNDDGSTDDSLRLLRGFAAAYAGQVSVGNGPRTGFSQNYISMISELPENPGYVCFADQDDIWLPTKITRALDLLETCDFHPTIYCGRHMYWYPEANRRIPAPVLNRPFRLENALIENVASGNTVMMNASAAALARKAAIRTNGVFAHDWWLYLLITACGGHVRFDNGAPQILYRQHAANLIGSGRAWRDQLRRKTGVIKGLFSERIDGNIAALQAVSDMMTPDARDILDRFAKAREADGLARLLGLYAVGPYRQKRRDTLGFWGAASLGRS